MMNGPELDERAGDLAAQGIRHAPTWVKEDHKNSELLLLDGRNRFEAIVRIKDAKHRVEIWKKASGNKVDVLGPQREPLRLRHLCQTRSAGT